MRIFLQKSVPIQPKTSNILPKFCQILQPEFLFPPFGPEQQDGFDGVQMDQGAAYEWQPGEPSVAQLAVRRQLRRK